MNVAFLGDSHLACLMAAARDNPDILQPGITPVFFAAPARNMENLVAEGSILKPSTAALARHLATSSDGTDVISPASYDAFVCIGLRYIFPRLDPRYSQAVNERVIAGAVLQSNHFRIVRLLRQITDKPVYCGHRPLRPETEEPSAIEQYEDIAGRIRSAVSDLNVTLISQPEDTRTASLATLPTFATEAPRLNSDDTHGAKTSGHMNAVFGAKYLRTLRPLLL